MNVSEEPEHTHRTSNDPVFPGHKFGCSHREITHLKGLHQGLQSRAVRPHMELNKNCKINVSTETFRCSKSSNNANHNIKERCRQMT